MSNQTVSVNRNFDDAAISGLANGEDITVNSNATLTINSDVRWGQQAAVVGNITIDSATGGRVLFDGRDVWWIPFDASSGNVPALGTVGTDDVTVGGSDVGEFLGIWTALGTAPLAAGGAMPASGFVKLRRKTATISDNDVLTFAGGATATVDSTTGGQRGWIHIVGEEATTITVPNPGTLECQGDFFLLGETDGTDDQTFQYPVTDCCPALFIEDGAGGYEIWLNGGARWGAAVQTIPTDERGRFFGCVDSTGVITIARRSSNSCGFKPPTGRKVYCPNIIISNSTSADWTANTINATAGTRWDVSASAGGTLIFVRMTGTWYTGGGLMRSVSMTECGVLEIIYADQTSSVTLLRCGIGVSVALTASAQSAIIVLNSENVSIVECVGLRYLTTGGNQLAFRISDSDSIELVDCIMYTMGSLTVATHVNADQKGYYLSRCTNMVVDGCASIGGTFYIEGGNAIDLVDVEYADCLYGTTATTNPFNGAIILASGASNVHVTGFTNYESLANVHPYNCIVYVTNMSYDIVIESIGSIATPYDCGSANACGYAVDTLNCHDIVVRRIVVVNTRVVGLRFGGLSYKNSVENLWSDYADTVYVSGKDGVFKGGKGTPLTAGVLYSDGSHWCDWWTSDTTGRLCVLGNAPTALSAGQCDITAGTPNFTGNGSANLQTIGDQITWTQPYFMLGATAFANTAPTLTGTNTGNLTIEFQYDTGSGWNGTWLALSGANLSGIGAIDPATGVKLRVRATRSSGVTSTQITQIRIDTVTDATSQQILYPLPEDATAQIDNVVVNSRLQVYNVTTDTELVNVEVNATSYSDTYTNGVGVSAGDVLRVRLTHTDGATAHEPYEVFVVASADGWSVYADQQVSAIYNAWAIDGSAQTGFSADGPNIDIDVTAGSYTKKALAAWWMYYITTEAGIRDFWGAFTLVSLAEIRQEVAVHDVKLQNTDDDTAVIFTDNDVRYYRSDFSLPYDTTAGSGAIYMDYSGVPLTRVGASALTATEQAQLASAARNAGLIPGLL